MRTGSNVGPTLSLYGVGIYQIGSPFPHVRQDVSVAAQRHGRIRMTEYIRHGPNVHPAPNHEGASGVAQVVDSSPSRRRKPKYSPRLTVVQLSLWAYSLKTAT